MVCVFQTQTSLRSKCVDMARRLRGLDLGQDRYKRRYWMLLHAGGVYVESCESSEKSVDVTKLARAPDASDVKRKCEVATKSPPQKVTKVEASVKEEVTGVNDVMQAVKVESAKEQKNAEVKEPPASSDVTPPLMNGHADDTHIKQLLKEHIVGKKQQPFEEKGDSCDVLSSKCAVVNEEVKSPKNSSSSIFDGPLFSPFTTTDTKPTSAVATNSAMFSFPSAAPPSPAGSDSSASSEASELSSISLRQNGNRSTPEKMVNSPLAMDAKHGSKKYDATVSSLVKSNLFSNSDMNASKPAAPKNNSEPIKTTTLPSVNNTHGNDVKHDETSLPSKTFPSDSTPDLSKSINAFITSLGPSDPTVTSSASSETVTSAAAAAAGLCTTVNVVNSSATTEQPKPEPVASSEKPASTSALTSSSMNILPSLPLTCSTPSALSAMSQLASLAQTSSPFSSPLPSFATPPAPSPLDSALYSKCTTQELSLMYASMFGDVFPSRMCPTPVEAPAASGQSSSATPSGGFVSMELQQLDKSCQFMRQQIEAMHKLQSASPQRVPTDMEKGWWRVTSREQMRRLCDALNTRGIRERNMRRVLMRHFDSLSPPRFNGKNHDGAFISIVSYYVIACTFSL